MSIKFWTSTFYNLPSLFVNQAKFLSMSNMRRNSESTGQTTQDLQNDGDNGVFT